MSESGLLVNPCEWVEQTLGELNEGLFEKDEAMAVSLLAVLSGQSVFLYGPPGTAKSLIARRLAGVFRGSTYFEYLMQRFSTPEEVFGPVSIAELKRDNYLRKTQNYLPTADLAFLDEIWKSSPAILNTLLTIINERKFKNGTSLADVPLKALIAASNEFPSNGSGLEALYDRFIVRVPVGPVTSAGDFEKMLSAGDVSPESGVSRQITSDEWAELIRASSNVSISSGVFAIVAGIRQKIAEYSAGELAVPIYISDRRWIKSMKILRTAAYLSGRDTVQPVDALLLVYCLWSSDADRKVVNSIVSESVKDFELSEDFGFSSWNERFTALGSEIRDVFKEEVVETYEPVLINGIGCYEGKAPIGSLGEEITVYVPFSTKSVGGIYQAWDMQRNAHKFQVMAVKGNEATIRFMERNASITVPMNFGDLVPVPENTRQTYLRSVDNAADDLKGIIASFEERVAAVRLAMVSAFVASSYTQAILSALDARLSEMKSCIPAVGELRSVLESHAA